MARNPQKDKRVLLPSQSRTALPTVSPRFTPDFTGIRLIVNITALTGSSLTFTLRGYNEVTNATSTLLASAVLSSTGTTVLQVYPGATAAANTAANAILPDKWDVTVTGTAGTATYSLTAVLIPA